MDACAITLIVYGLAQNAGWTAQVASPSSCLDRANIFPRLGPRTWHIVQAALAHCLDDFHSFNLNTSSATLPSQLCRSQSAPNINHPSRCRALLSLGIRYCLNSHGSRANARCPPYLPHHYLMLPMIWTCQVPNADALHRHLRHLQQSLTLIPVCYLSRKHAVVDNES